MTMTKQKVLSEKFDPDYDPVVCPSCGFEGDLDDYDNLGLCKGWYLFCNKCSRQFDPGTDEVHDGRTCEVCKAERRALR